MLIKTLATAAIVGMVAIVPMANASYTPTKPITKEFTTPSGFTSVTINPSLAISGEPGQIKVALKATVDATEFQSDLPRLLNKKWKYDECGQRLSTNNASIRPGANGQLLVGITVQAQLWKCVSAHVPVIRNRMVNFGIGKTKIPYVTMELRVAKTRLVSQSVRLELAISPVINGDTITARVKVTKAMPAGLAKTLVQVFGLHGTIKKAVQSEVNKSVRGERFKLPAEIQAYKVVLKNAKFVDLGNGRLGLKIDASGLITQEQLVALIDEKSL